MLGDGAEKSHDREYVGIGLDALFVCVFDGASDRLLHPRGDGPSFDQFVNFRPADEAYDVPVGTARSTTALDKLLDSCARCQRRVLVGKVGEEEGVQDGQFLVSDLAGVEVRSEATQSTVDF